MNLFEVADDLAGRLMGAFLRQDDGKRPVHGGQTELQTDPRWKDLLLFYEYIHGDNGAGIGASHQTGWTGLVGALPLVFRHGSEQALARSRGDLSGSLIAAGTLAGASVGPA